MLKINCLVILLVCFSTGLFAQEKDSIVNPKGKLYFGIEVGSNTISSFEFNEPTTSFQGGLLAEYYFARHWSVSGRIKYYKIGASFSDDGSSINFSNKTAYNSGRFMGEAIMIPMDIKWEFRLYKNFAGFLKLGYALSIETKSEYSDYSPAITENFSNYSYSLFAGYGLNYFINDKDAVFISVESFIGGNKGKQNGGLNIFDDGRKYLTNTLVNVGYKRCFFSVI
ncbi:outer membrane beta-barrel protein [Flavobacterium sp. J49]|uniref:outer membrane beta-barrel protein n=1 Tax=Flavobacterium sp. J49 TaxID=2718534 RepID=UPI001593A708|nr:outer membrane beta-barrel protein [Flavobacterium sp. J49]MBF6642056.1 outer membrane beta-barrel protein [Flavobacterium sp. J49]NIC03304.1 PorT family protein [Flavobacterium sp. J49]